MTFYNLAALFWNIVGYLAFDTDDSNSNILKESDLSLEIPKWMLKHLNCLKFRKAMMTLDSYKYNTF